MKDTNDINHQITSTFHTGRAFEPEVAFGFMRRLSNLSFRQVNFWLSSAVTEWVTQVRVRVDAIKPADNVTLFLYPMSNPRLRLAALWSFALLLTAWNILGHTILGFEQSWAHAVAGVDSAILTQILLDRLDAYGHQRPPRLRANLKSLAEFLPPPIITGLACGMLIYPNSHLGPVIFASVVAIASKVLIRAPFGNGRNQHVFNPSNIGVAVTLLLFPWVGFAPPYHFTRNLAAGWQWVVPVLILMTGIVIHGLFTARLPLCLAWLGGFFLQGVIRAWYFHDSWFVPLIPMTSAAFIVFTLYMIPDPATTPIRPLRQIAFGLAVAAAFGVLQVTHQVFGLFLSLLLASAARGIAMYVGAAFHAIKETAVVRRPAEAMAVTPQS